MKAIPRFITGRIWPMKKTLTTRIAHTNHKEPDLNLLYACFDILNDYMEAKWHTFSYVSWNESDELRARKRELFLLNAWWEKRLLLDKSSGVGNSNTQYDEDNEMLHRLVRVRDLLRTKN